MKRTHLVGLSLPALCLFGRFLGRANWLLSLGALGFVIAGIGVAIGFGAALTGVSQLSVPGPWIALLGIMLGHVAVLFGIRSMLIGRRKHE